MTTGLNQHPSYSATQACDALECGRRAFHIVACRTEKCCYEWQRAAAADRARRDLADEKAGATG